MKGSVNMNNERLRYVNVLTAQPFILSFLHSFLILKKSFTDCI